DQPGVAFTSNITSPLVVYGDTSQNAKWYNGRPDTMSHDIFGSKPMPHEDNLSVQLARPTASTATIKRLDGKSWADAGFVVEGLISIDGTPAGTVSTVSDNGDTLTLIDVNVAPNAFPAPGTGIHTGVQRSRLGQGAEFFIFPIANRFTYHGNDVIDAHLLFAGMPDGLLPAVGLTAYGGRGDDTIIGSQAGDHLAGGSGDDLIIGQRGVDHIYGDSGVNVDVIPRVLSVVNPKNPPTRQDFDPLRAAKDLLYGESAGVTTTDAAGDYDDVIFGDLGDVGQDVAGPRDTTRPLPALPQRIQTTLRARTVVSRDRQNGADDFLYGNGGEDILV